MRFFVFVEFCSIVFCKGVYNEFFVLDRRSVGVVFVFLFVGVLGNVIVVFLVVKVVVVVGCWVFLVFFGEFGEVDFDGVWDCVVVLVEFDLGVERFV